MFADLDNKDMESVMDIKTMPGITIGNTNSSAKEGDVSAIIDVHERTVLRKIDRRIIPLMFGCYCLQYLDKTLGIHIHLST